MGRKNKREKPQQKPLDCEGLMRELQREKVTKKKYNKPRYHDTAG